MFLKLSSRRTDISARFGGDEFLILLENCASNESINIANKIRENFSAGLPGILGNWETGRDVIM
jgi:diguanylate cyclase (GGDEF)-like protein